MTRLQLDLGGLARLTVGSTVGPLGELLLSLEVLHRRRPHPLTAVWERAVRLDGDVWMPPLPAMTPAALMAACRWREQMPPVRRSIDAVDRGRRRRSTLPVLLRRYQEVALDPYWPSILAHLEAERAARGQITIEHGVGHLLTTLHPLVRWRPPFLDVGTSDRSTGPRKPIVLGEATVTLVPSVFCLDQPRVLLDPEGERSACLVIYPALRGPEDAAALWAGEAPLDHRALASLLGRTRACALEAIAATTCNTTELARRIGVSPATASHHADALRRTRLIVSRRIGSATSHRLTALGAALLDPGARKRRATVGVDSRTSNPSNGGLKARNRRSAPQRSLAP